MKLELPELIKPTRRSFLGWMSSLTVVAVTTKIIPANLEDLKCMPEITATELDQRWSVSVNEYLIRSRIWSEELNKIILDDLFKFTQKEIKCESMRTEELQ